MARQKHGAWEPTIPPPSQGLHGDNVRPKQTSLAEHVERHAPLFGNVQKIVLGIMALCTLFGAVGTGVYRGFIWAVDHAVEARIAGLKRQLDPSVLLPTEDELKELARLHKPVPPTITEQFQAQAASIAKVQASLDAPNNPQSEMGRKLDNLDRTLRERLAPRPNKTPLPSVGPTSAKEGRN